MSARITLKPGERGLVWVFAVDLNVPEIKAFTRRNGSWPLQEALGADIAAPEHAEVIQTEDLEGLGLIGYLEDGMGIPTAQLTDMRTQLEAVRGAVLVLSAKAFPLDGASFTPQRPLRLIGSFSEERPDMGFAPLHSDAATDPAPPKDAPVSEAPQKNTAGIAAVVALGLTLIGFALLVWARF